MLTYVPKSLLLSPWIKLDIILIVKCGLYKHALLSHQAKGGRLVFDVDGKQFPAMPAMQGEEWRTVRHALTPAFSGRKMKLVSETATCTL